MSFDNNLWVPDFSICIEIDALVEGYELISSTIGRLKQKEEENLQLVKCKDEDEAIEHWSIYQHQVDIFYPRVFWGAHLVSIFAVLESSLYGYADLIRLEKNITLTMREINGGLLTKAKCYFSKVLEIELHKNSNRWQTIHDLSVIRNSFAHQNGWIGSIDEQSKIQKVIDKNVGVEENMQVLELKQEFVKASLDAVISLLTDVKNEYRKLLKQRAMQLKK